MAIAAVTCNNKKATSASVDGPVVLRLSVTDSSGSPGQRLVIKLPEWRVLRIVARSVLVALALVSLPWLGLGNNAANNNNAATATVDAAVWNHEQQQQQHQPIDDVYFLPMLLRDLKRSGVFQPNGGRAVYLGAHAHLRIPFLRRNAVEPVTLQTVASVPDRSVGLLLAADGVRDAATVASVDRLVGVGGVVAVRLSDDPAHASPMPHNYMLTYVRRFGGSTIVAMKKTADLHASAGAAATGRKLLMMPIALSKKEALDGLEDVLLEPPRGSSRSSANKFLKRTRYLPDLTGDTLDGYPRLVFVDVGPGPGRGDNRWFDKHYPTRNRQFEIIRVETEEDGSTMVDPPPPEDNDEEEWMEPEDGVSTWLRANVREEDYVVMKAEAEVVEGLVRSRAIELVDELFFGCSNQWQKSAGRRLRASRRAYWECLALYGKLRDKGVAVHQWWG